MARRRLLSTLINKTIKRNKNMPKPLSEQDMGVDPCWKVRIIMRGMGNINMLSRTKPVVLRNADSEQLEGVMMTPINGTEYGDTLGFIDWSAVSAVSWRKAGNKDEATATVPDPDEPLYQLVTRIDNTVLMIDLSKLDAGVNPQLVVADHPAVIGAFFNKDNDAARRTCINCRKMLVSLGKKVV